MKRKPSIEKNRLHEFSKYTEKQTGKNVLGGSSYSRPIDLQKKGTLKPMSFYLFVKKMTSFILWL